MYDLGTPSSYCDVEIVQGTPNAGQPATPSAALLLAVVTVASGASNITAGSITDKRTFTVAPGCVLPIANAASSPGFTGTPQIVYNQATGALAVGAGGGVEPLASPGKPVMSVVSTSSGHGLTNGTGPVSWGIGYGTSHPATAVNTDGSPVLEMSLTFTADGKSDWEFFWRWGLIVPVLWLRGGSGRVNGAGQMIMSVDGVPVDSTYFKASVNAGGALLPGDPGCASYFTSSQQGTTPSAGTHTLTLSIVTESTFSSGYDCGVVIGAWGASTFPGGLPGITPAFLARLSEENVMLRATPVPA